jgi:NCS1 family nucleobase:cation symporter-1
MSVAAKVASPAQYFSNLYPRRISLMAGGVIPCFAGLVMQPWKLLASYGNYIFGRLVGYWSFLRPIAGVLIADYYVVQKRSVRMDDLIPAGRHL